MSDQLRDERNVPMWMHFEIDDMGLSPNDLRVYIHLVRRAGNHNSAWPSVQSIGDHCFVGVYAHPDTRRKEARKAIANLIKAGLLSKQERVREDGGQSSHLYTLLNPTPLGRGEPRGGDATVPAPGTPPSPEVNTNISKVISSPAAPDEDATPPSEPTLPVPDSAAGGKRRPAPAAPVPRREVDPTQHQQMMQELSYAFYGHRTHKMWTEQHAALLARTAKILLGGGATPQMVTEWKEKVWPAAWPGDKGQQPTYNQFMSGFGAWREQRSKQVQYEVLRPPDEEDPYGD